MAFFIFGTELEVGLPELQTKERRISMKVINSLSPNAHWLLRLAIASVFVYHGLTKFPVLSPMAEMMKMPVLMLFLVATAETVGGALVFLGGFFKDWMTRIGALLLAPVMLGAIFMVHWGQWHYGHLYF